MGSLFRKLIGFMCSSGIGTVHVWSSAITAELVIDY